MGKLIYKKSFKLISPLIQMIAVGALFFSILNIGFWLEDTYSIREMATKYEQTKIFFEQIDEILADKIAGQKNQELFENDGELNLSKDIDIQSFGESDANMVQDMNTSYTLSDLILFGQNGGLKALHSAIEWAEHRQADTGIKAGDFLIEQSGQLETILPVTGISLAEYATWYTDPADYVLSVYQKLEAVCTEIQSRYREYTLRQDESWSAKAPSNLAYCIEDSNTGELYTNTGAPDYRTAVKKILYTEKFDSLFEGQRSQNIMVTNPERVLNPEAESWFMGKHYISANERIFLAVNTHYPVSDALKTYAQSFSQRGFIIRFSFAVAIAGLIILIVGFMLSMFGAGWDEGHITPRLYLIDQIPTELAVGIFLIILILYLLIFGKVLLPPSQIHGGRRIFLSVIMATAYFCFLVSACSFMRRIRAHVIWKNSVAYMLVKTWKQVTSSRTASIQILFTYTGFFVLNFFFLLFGRVGMVLIFILDMAALLYILRNMAGKQNVWEGIQQISKGDLKYKIDTSALQGETYEMARAVNEMGDGLAEAVDAIIKNERLKAELITNVSHDIKTPLTSIVNYVDLLKRENLQGERVQHYIEVLDQKSQRLKQLTEDLVEASKISSGNVKLELMLMPLQSLLRQACGEFQERLEERGLTYEWNMEKEPILVMADGKQLWRIFENVLGNIYKYAKEDTKVNVSLSKEGEQAVLILKNRSREVLTISGEELAGRFVRGDKSRNTEGSGLGLSIAQSLTELHGGTFTPAVEGDIFQIRITLPVAQEEVEKE